MGAPRVGMDASDHTLIEAASECSESRNELYD
jgi:hypothetical protein